MVERDERQQSCDAFHGDYVTCQCELDVLLGWQIVHVVAVDVWVVRGIHLQVLLYDDVKYVEEWTNSECPWTLAVAEYHLQTFSMIHWTQWVFNFLEVLERNRTTDL